MTAYDFTRFEADRVHALKARAYDVDVIAFKIDLANPDVNFKERPAYAEAKDTFMELTMSCAREEAIAWCKRWMLNALAYASQTKDLAWREFFLAAYDLHKSLIKEGK